MLATVLAAVGLYGVLAYTVSQRTREFGLRMALGADGAMVRALVLRQVLWMTVVGGVVGLVLAIGIGRGAQSLLFELQGWDPAVLSLSAALLGAVALRGRAAPGAARLAHRADGGAARRMRARERRRRRCADSRRLRLGRPNSGPWRAPLAAVMRRPSGFLPLCLLFFLSGVCGLTYQVLWLRLLSLVFGVTVHAASTVLASFMAGLALGAILAERIVRRGHPLRVFAVLEAGIAVAALATPVLLDLASAPLPAAVGRAARLAGPAHRRALRVLVGGAARAHRAHGRDAAGAEPRADRCAAPRRRAWAPSTPSTPSVRSPVRCVTGYVLIGGLGMQRTFYLAAVLNLLVAAGAWWLSFREAAGRPGAGPLTDSAARPDPCWWTDACLPRRSSS